MHACEKDAQRTSFAHEYEYTFVLRSNLSEDVILWTVLSLTRRRVSCLSITRAI